MHLHACVRVRKHVQERMCLQACMCTCVHACARVRVFARTHTHVCASMCMSARVCKRARTCTRVHTPASMHVQAYANITQACRSKTHWTGTAPRVGTHGWVSEARSVILPKSGGSAAVLHRRLGLFLNPLAPSDSHAACSPLLPGKFYATKIDVLEGMGCAARPQRRKAGCSLPADRDPGQDDGLGEMLAQTPSPPGKQGRGY